MLSRSLGDRSAVDHLSAVLNVASQPAPDHVVGREVVTLLNAYFVSPLPPEQSAAVASIWLEIIGNPPEWALHDACVWWLGPHNMKCAKKPVPGEIAQRVKALMQPLQAAQIAIDRHEAGLGPLRAWEGEA